MCERLVITERDPTFGVVPDPTVDESGRFSVRWADDVFQDVKRRLRKTIETEGRDPGALTVQHCMALLDLIRTTVCPDTAQVEIPGQMVAHYRNGQITEWVWLPSASYAGYFGEPAVIFEANHDLEAKSTDGPFWRAVQESIAGGDFKPKWEE